MCVSRAILKLNCHAFAVKLTLLLAIPVLLLGCAPSDELSFPAPATPPDTAPPFDEALAEQELTDENAANTDQHSDDELTEFEPGLATDAAAIKSAFFTGTEDFCAAAFAQLGGAAIINGKKVTISWCRDLASKLLIPASATNEALAHAAGWNDTKSAVFFNRTELCSNTRCVSSSAFPYPF